MALNIYTKPVKTKGGLDAAKAQPAPKKKEAAATKPAAPPVAKDTFEASKGVKSPRDASSGLATGRRQHKPLILTME